MAEIISDSVRPSITISRTKLDVWSNFEFTIPLKVGQYSKFVDAIKFLYFEPTFEPDLTIPPGNVK